MYSSRNTAKIDRVTDFKRRYILNPIAAFELRSIYIYTTVNFILSKRLEVK